jgi:lysophospholipase L1-like esterase
MGLHDAVATGVPSYTPGKIGNAYNAGSGGKLSPAGSMVSAVGTVEAWVYGNGTGKIRVAIGNDLPNATSQWIGHSATGTAQAGVGTATVTSTVVINDSVWHHLALTLDGTTAKLYVDGVLAGSTASTQGVNLPYGTAIAQFGSNTTYPWSGYIDEIRVSSVVRYTDTFTPSTTEFATDANTLGLFHLDSNGRDSSSTASPAYGPANGYVGRGTPSFTTDAAKFGTNGLAAGVYRLPAWLDAIISSTEAGGGALTGGPNGFTIEAWARTTASGSNRVAIGHDQWYWFGVGSTGKGMARYGSTAGTEVTINSTITVNDGLWHHYALVFHPTLGVLFCVDGTVVSSTTAKSAGGSTFDAAIGGNSSTGSASDWAGGSGVIDEVRFSNVARYSGAYTVPTAAFVDDANTVALYHLESDASDSHVSSTPATAPGAPTNLTASALDGAVSLSWTAPANGGSAITDYIVEMQPAGGAWSTYADGVGTATSGTVSGLTNGTAYSFRVSAVNSVGTGSASNVPSATPSSTATPTPTTALIAPNDLNILYSPYNWLVSSTAAKSINPGAYFKCLLTGSPTSITLGFDLTNISTPLPQISYRIDGGPWVSQEVAASVVVAIPSSNTWTKHLVEVRFKSMTETVNRWNSPQNTALVFTGITVAPATGVATASIRKRKLTIAAFGDSITEGVRVLSSTATKGTDGNDSAQSWSGPLADLMGAELGNIGFGGTGLSKSGSGNVPATGTSYNLLWAGQARSFAVVPDLIVINIGHNDQSTDTTAAGTAFLNGLLAATPSTTKIAVVQPWSGRQATYLKAAIAACSTPSRVTYIDTTGWWSTADAPDAVHPYGYVNLADLAPRLALALRAILGASKRYLNVSGTAVPISETIA